MSLGETKIKKKQEAESKKKKLISINEKNIET